MKEFKDAFISDNAYYFLLGYLNETKFQPIYNRHLEKYDEKTGHPTFCTSWMTKEQAFELLEEAIKYYFTMTEEITLENIEKYLDK